jgi:hypothetical protein
VLVVRDARDLATGKAATDIAQENQAVKRQKLDDGGVRQVWE